MRTAFTVRFSEAEQAMIDNVVSDLRARTANRRLSQAEITRELFGLLYSNELLREGLAARLIGREIDEGTPQ